MNNSFESMVVDEQFINAGTANFIKYILLVGIVLFLLKLVLKNLKIMRFICPLVTTMKMATCFFAVFFVFFFDFETKTISFSISEEPMLFSTFLVGSLAVWEILSTLASYLLSLEDCL